MELKGERENVVLEGEVREHKWEEEQLYVLIFFFVYKMTSNWYSLKQNKRPRLKQTNKKIYGSNLSGYHTHMKNVGTVEWPIFG